MRAVTMAKAARKGTSDISQLLTEAEDVRAVFYRAVSAADEEVAAECVLALESVFGAYREPVFF